MLTGQTIKGYLIEELIGEGGFGAVYAARQTIIERKVAMKMIWPELANIAAFVRRFESEARMIASLEHSQIVPIYDFWRDPDGAFLVMRLLRGGNLRQASKRKQQWKTNEVMQIMAQISSATALAHRYDIVHRDLKPENILLDEEGNAYLGDFGIAQALDERQDELFTTGSPSYASPEQLQGDPPIAASDQYSLAVILYELLTGQLPFPDLSKLSLTELMEKRSQATLPRLHTLRPDLPDELSEVLLKATSLRPEDRFEDMTAFAQAFHHALQIRSSSEGVALSPVEREMQPTPGGTPPLSKFLTALMTDIQPNPYKGLRAFQEEDAQNFFGRERLLQHYLLNRLSEKEDFHRFMAVVGPSGSGKSSLVKAGLLPALRTGHLPGSANWFYAEMTPNLNPFEELETALLSISMAPHANLTQQLAQSNEGLHRVIEQILPADHTELVLFIDQFEEIFTQTDDEAQIQHFLNSLFYAVTHLHSRLRLIITLRADFYDRPLLYENFSLLMHRRTEVVIPMNAQELEAAIVLPAQRSGVTFEAGVVPAIIAEVSGHLGLLPLLQYGLTELYERRNGSVIRMETYRKIGGILGALVRRAEETFLQMDSASQDITRQIMLRLVTLGEGTEDTRRRVLLTELTSMGLPASIVTAVIEMFSQARLLTFDRDPSTRSPTVEVAHEAILREWIRLRTWLERDRDNVRLQRMLSLLTTEWQQSGHDPSFLLRGTRLQQFEEWQQSTSLALTREEQNFLQTSIAARETQRIAELQQQTRQRLLEKRTQNLVLLTLAIVTTAAIAAFILAFIAFNQSEQAEQARATSEANAQTSQSLALTANAQAAFTTGDLDLALALALEANSFNEVPDESRRFLANVAFSPGTRHIYEGHQSSLYKISLSPDGQLAATSSADGTIIIWEVETGRQRYQLTGHADAVRSVAFSPDGKRLVSGSNDQTLILWDAATGQLLLTLEGHTGVVRAVDFSPDNQTVVSASADSSAILWDANTGEQLAILEGHTGAVITVAFSPDGQQVASGGEDQSIILWGVESQAEMRRLEGHTSPVRTLSYHPSRPQLISGAEDNSLILWNIETGEALKTFRGHTRFVHGTDFSPDGRQIVSGAADNTVIVWNTDTGQAIRAFHSTDGIVFAVKVMPDGRSILTGHASGRMRLWDLTSVGEQWRYNIGEFGIVDLGYHPASSRMVVATGPTDIFKLEIRPIQLFLIDSSSGTVLRETQAAPNLIAGIAFSPDGQTFATNLFSGEIWLWDVNTMEVIRQFEGARGIGTRVTFSPDGRTLLSGTMNGFILLWDVATGEMIQSLDTHTGIILSLAFSPDGRMFASGSEDNRAIIWDTQTREPIYTIEEHSSDVFTASFSPDGTKLLTGGSDTRLLMWDIANQTLLREYNGHSATIASATFSSDMHHILSGGDDYSLLLWDTNTGEVQYTFSGHTNSITRVAFSLDGQNVFSVSLDGSLRQWDVPNQEFLNAAGEWVRQNRYIYLFTCEERQLYRLPLTRDC